MIADAPTLGAVPDDHGTAFAVFSRGDLIELCLLDEDGNESRVAMTARAGGADGVWTTFVAGVQPGQRYGFRAHGPWDPSRGQRFDPSHLLVDPYALAVDGAGRSIVVDRSFDWQGVTAPHVPWSETVVYEAHVRGLTRLHPAVPEHLRGTYAGLAHPDTIGHLRDLGVTTVELLPVHQFVSEPALTARGAANFWGYSSLAFFAPHGPYASSGQGGGQVAEFKEMVRELHRGGLEVVLDVVYNHTAEGGAEGPTLSLRGLDNEAYYRLRHDGSYDDTTGCGNSLDLRHPRALALVTDSLRYWVQEMHIDGFRFDLAPTLARGSSGFDHASAFLAVNAQDPILSRVKLIAEPWDLGPGGYQLGGFPSPWAEWNDRFRDTVRSAWLGGHGHGRGGLRDLAFRLTGSSDVFEPSGRGPLGSVNFVTAHDGFTLRDLVTYDHKHNEDNGEHNRDGTDNNHSWNCGVEGETDDRSIRMLRHRMMRNLLTTLLMSAGVPMLTAGDETGRTQGGNNNAYCLDDETTWVDWDHSPWQRDLYDWTRALLTLRRDTAVLRTGRFFVGRPAAGAAAAASSDIPKDLTWYGVDGAEMSSNTWFEHDLQVLGMALSPGQTDGSLLVWLNTGPDAVTVMLPSTPGRSSYDVLLDTRRERPDPGPSHEAGASVELAGHSVLVLAPRT